MPTNLNDGLVVKVI